MQLLKVKTKIIDTNITTPQLSYAKAGDAGIDLVATSKTYDDDENIVYGTNRAFEIPNGYVGLLFPRSSNSKQDLLLSNSVGVLDSGYRGEVMFKFKPSQDVSGSKVKLDNSDCKVYSATFGNALNLYNVGDRVGQLIIMPYPHIDFEEVEHLSDSERGSGGYGSTGK